MLLSSTCSFINFMSFHFHPTIIQASIHPAAHFQLWSRPNLLLLLFRLCLSVCIYVYGYLVIYHDEYDEEQVQNQKYFYLLSCFSFPSYCCWCFFVSLQVLYFYVLHSTLPKFYSMLYGFFLQDSFYLYHHKTIVIIIMITPPSSLSSIKSTWLFLLLQSTKKKPWLCLLCLMSKSSSSSSWSFIFIAFLSLSLSFFKTNNKRTAHYLQQKIRLLFLLLFLIIFSSSLTLVLFSKFALSLSWKIVSQLDKWKKETKEEKAE